MEVLVKKSSSTRLILIESNPKKIVLICLGAKKFCVQEICVFKEFSSKKFWVKMILVLKVLGQKIIVLK